MVLETLCNVDWVQFWIATSALGLGVSSVLTLRHQQHSNTFAANHKQWLEYKDRWEAASHEEFRVEVHFGPKVYLESPMPRVLSLSTLMGNQEGTQEESWEPVEQSLTITKNLNISVLAATSEKVSIPEHGRKTAYSYEFCSLPPLLDYEEKRLEGADLNAASQALMDLWKEKFSEKMDEGDDGEIWLDLVRHAASLLVSWKASRKFRTRLMLVFYASIGAGGLALGTILFDAFSTSCPFSWF